MPETKHVDELKGIKVERKKLADYIQNPQNPVAHSPRNYGVLIDSIQEVGAFRSGAASKGKMLAGNLTLEAMAEAGIEEVLEVTTDGKVWVVVNREDMTPEQERKAAYYDQRSATLADWNPEQIVLDIEAGLDLGGMFYEDELKDILAGIEIEKPEAPEPQVDKAEELQKKWGTARGQLWTLPSKTVKGKAHRLMCGDSTCAEDVERLIARVKTGEERRKTHDDEQLFKLTITFEKHQGELVKRVLGKHPAQMLLRLCEKELAGPSSLVAGDL